MKYKLNKKRFSYLLVAMLIVVFLGYQGYAYIQPIWFPKKENLDVNKWSTYTEFFGEKPLFTIRYPKGWLITKQCGGGGFPCININSTWNVKNNIDKSFIHVSLEWEEKKTWGGGGDPFLGSSDINYRLFDNNEDFTESRIDGHRALFATKGINGDYENNVYILTDKPLFQEDAPSPENNAVFRFEMTYDTKQNPEEIKEIYHQIVNSFNYLEQFYLQLLITDIDKFCLRGDLNKFLPRCTCTIW